MKNFLLLFLITMISCCSAENSSRKSQNGSTMQKGSTIQNQNYHDKLKTNVVYIDQELADTITREPDFSKYQKTNGSMINTLSDVKDTDNSGIVDANAQYQKGIKSFRKGNYKSAFKLLRSLAENGLADAQYYLGYMYQYGKGVPVDYLKSMDWYKGAADQQHPSAQFNLGVMYQKGYGVNQDFKSAAKWYKLAAEQEYPSAQHYLGYLYHTGKGVRQNYKNASKWYERAGKQNYGLSLQTLGVMYEYGEGVSTNYNKALKFYILAGKQGLDVAQNTVGSMYFNGVGVDRDLKQSAKWFGVAAKQGNSVAQSNFGLMHQFGFGVPQNYKEANRWYNLAAKKNNVIAQYHLGSMYWNGLGSDKDPNLAHFWINIAAYNGNQNAKILRGHIEKSMTSAQLQKNKRVSEKFIKKNYRQDTRTKIKVQKDQVNFNAIIAKSRNGVAQQGLASAYWNKQGISSDQTLAYFWASLASANGNRDARNLKSYISLRISDVQRSESNKMSDVYIGNNENRYQKNDDIQLKRFVGKSGTGFALNHVASLFNSGNGVEQNQITAFLLAHLSVHNGYENGQILIHNISEKMKRSDLQVAKKITQEFIKTRYTLSEVNNSASEKDEINFNKLVLKKMMSHLKKLEREQLEKLEHERLGKTADLEKDPRERSLMNKFFVSMFDSNRNKPEGGWAAYHGVMYNSLTSNDDKPKQVSGSRPTIEFVGGC
jgi:TPR repeat protein